MLADTSSESARLQREEVPTPPDVRPSDRHIGSGFLGLMTQISPIGRRSTRIELAKWAMQGREGDIVPRRAFAAMPSMLAVGKGRGGRRTKHPSLHER